MNPGAYNDVTDNAQPKRHKTNAGTPRVPSPPNTVTGTSNQNRGIAPSMMENQVNNLKKKGFLVDKLNNGRAIPTFPHVKLNKRDGTPGKLCFNYITRNAYCQFGDRCFNVHVNDIATLPPSAKTELEAYVNTHSSKIGYVNRNAPGNA